MGLTPFGCFSPKRRFENQKPTKTKKQALCFSLLFDLFVHNVLQLSNFFLQDLERLVDFTKRFKKDYKYLIFLFLYNNEYLILAISLTN